MRLVLSHGKNATGVHEGEIVALKDLSTSRPFVQARHPSESWVRASMTLVNAAMSQNRKTHIINMHHNLL